MTGRFHLKPPGYPHYIGTPISGGWLTSLEPDFLKAPTFKRGVPYNLPILAT
jgi:hypothetical protein